MSTNDLDEALVELLRKRGKITARGSLERHIAPMLQLGKRSSGYRKAANVLDRTECRKQVTITWRGEVRKAVELFDPTINPKDDSEVTVRTEEEVVLMQEVVEGQDEWNINELSLLEQLNKALKVLQTAADEDDSIHGPINQVMIEKLGATESLAKKLSSLLDKLELRQLVGTRRNPVYMIDVSVDTVTQDMLDKLKKSKLTEANVTIATESIVESTSQATASESVGLVGEELVLVGVVTQLGQELQPIDAASVIAIMDDGLPPIEQLAERLIAANECIARRDEHIARQDELIARRDEHIARQDDQIARQDEYNGRLASERDSFESQLQLANATIGGLNGKVRQYEVLSPRVIELLRMEPNYS